MEHELIHALAELLERRHEPIEAPVGYDVGGRPDGTGFEQAITLRGRVLVGSQDTSVALSVAGTDGCCGRTKVDGLNVMRREGW